MQSGYMQFEIEGSHAVPHHECLFSQQLSWQAMQLWGPWLVFDVMYLETTQAA